MDKEKVTELSHAPAIGQIHEALSTTSRYLSEAAAALATGTVPALGLPAEPRAPPAGVPAAPPAFTAAGIHAAPLLSSSAVHVAHAVPVVASAVPLLAPAGLPRAQ
jgi:hypothetical protein